MLKVNAAPLDPELQAALDKKQSQINEIVDFAQQVKIAEALWASKPKSTFSQIRAELAALCGGLLRCHYCEDSLADEIEHIRPKKFYPSKTFAWQNYLFVCGPCNGSHKRDNWAVLDGEGRLQEVKELGTLDGEPALAAAFIDPRCEDPCLYLRLDAELGIYFELAEAATSAWQRAHYTSKTLKLNRDFLIRARRNAYRDYLRDTQAYLIAKGTDAVQAQREMLRLKERHHPSVWAEIKRMAQTGEAHQDIFAAAPELWDV